MTKRKAFFVLLFALGLFVFSCNKWIINELGQTAVENDSQDQALVMAAKQYFNKSLRREMLDSLDVKFAPLTAGRATKSSSVSQPKPRVYALWKKARTTVKGDRQVVEAPFHSSHRTVSLLNITRDSLGYKPDRTMTQTIFDRLVVIRPHSGADLVSKIVRYHPDRSYLEKHNYDMSHLHLYNLGDYTGYLEYLTYTGSRKAIIRVVNGRPVRKYRGKAWSSPKPELSRGMSAMSGGGYLHCTDVCEDIIGIICVGNPNDPDNPDDEICSEDVIGQDCYEECEWIEDPEEPDFCDLPENWEDCYGEVDPGGIGNEIVIKDKSPVSYPWRNLFATSHPDDFLQKTTPKMIVVNGVEVANSEAYNCHYHSFGPNSNAVGYDPQWPKWAIVPSVAGYSRVPIDSGVEPGDRVVYFSVDFNGTYGVTHSGIVLEVDNEGFAIKISSKMGEYEIIEHHPRDIPEMYGSTDPSVHHAGQDKPSRVYYREN